jgi:hypothetical protein
VQGVVCGLDVGTMTPRATSTIDKDELVSRQRLDALAQLLHSGVTGGGADVLRTGNVRLRVKDVGADLNHQGVLGLGGLKSFDQILGIDEPRAGNEAGLGEGHDGE